MSKRHTHDELVGMLLSTTKNIAETQDTIRRQGEEIGRLQDYSTLLERGLGSYEARETVWPSRVAGAANA